VRWDWQVAIIEMGERIEKPAGRVVTEQSGRTEVLEAEVSLSRKMELLKKPE